MDISADGFLWIKSLHIIAVISWMAALLYLPRLFVYHAGVAHESPEAKLLEVMEYRLQRYIMNPAMLATWALGLLLLSIPGLIDWKADIWMHSKFLLVLLLSGVHGFLSVCRKKLANGTNTRSPKFYRVLNEVPTLLMIGIVILVVVKP